MPKLKTKKRKWSAARRAAQRRPLAVILSAERARRRNEEAGLSSNPNDRRRKAPRFDLIPRGPLARLADRYELGLRYGRDAWRAGLNLDDAYNHVVEHLAAFNEKLRLHKAGKGPNPRKGDDDLAAAAWGCFALMEYQDLAK